MKTMNLLSKLKNWSINAGLALISVIVCLVILETLVRVYVPTWYPRYAFTADPDLGYINTPNHFFRLKSDEFDISSTTNSHGFRDDPFEKDGREVIMALGDSFAWGFGAEYDQIFLTQLENETGMRVIKAGVCGYGTIHAARLFESKWRVFEPDIVLLNFFIGNDFYENVGKRNLTVIDGWFREIAGEDSSLTYRTVTWLRGRLRLVEFVIGKIKNSIALYDMVARLGFAKGELIGEMDIYKTEESPSVKKAYQRTFEIITKLNQEVAGSGAKLVVAIIPTKNQVDPKLFTIELKRAGKSIFGYDLEAPNKRLMAMLDELTIAYIDLTPGFRDRQRKNPDSKLYFAIDRHWNAEGHDLAASLLAKTIKGI